jgi:alpha-tubulin suppressor-like RCC1 family protein
VVAVLVVGGCAPHAVRPTADRRDPANCPRITVRVTGEDGQPLSGVAVHSVASYWAGPDGAFYYEGGGRQERESQRVMTDASGLANVCNASVAANAERAEINATPEPSVWYGGFGATRAGSVSDLAVIATRDGWPRARVALGLGIGPLDIVLGPPRSVQLDVRSRCAPEGVTVRIDSSITPDAPHLARSGSQVTLSGLGPFAYTARVECCGSASDHAIDGATARGIVTLDTGSPAPHLATPIASLALGRETSCAVTTEGTVACWGGNAMGMLGDGSSLAQPRPVRVANLDEVAEVGVGSMHACARRRDGSVWCWGDNTGGQLGIGTSTGHDAVAKPIPGLVATSLSVGRRHSCAITADRQVACWGSNDYGQLGVGDRVEKTVPTPVIGLTDVEEVRAGTFHSCARVRGGAVKCWGWDSAGQLGDGGQGIAAYRTTPVLVNGARNVTQLALGVHHTCAKSGRDLVCWGEGTGLAPSKLLHTGDVELVATAMQTCIALTSGGVSCWTGSSRPIPVPGVVGKVVDLEVGDGHACALVADGSVVCWGSNTAGQLGDGACTRSYAPPSNAARVF